MALILCPECEREVSSAAAACPGCGHPIATPSVPGLGLASRPAQSSQLQKPSERQRLQCAGCGSDRLQYLKEDNRAAGCVVALLGAALCTFIIGIPIVIWGLRMMNEGGEYMVCAACGQKRGLAAIQQAAAAMAPAPPGANCPNCRRGVLISWAQADWLGGELPMGTRACPACRYTFPP